MPAKDLSLEHEASRAVPLGTILPFAILGGNALVHDYLSRQLVSRSFSRDERGLNDGSGPMAGASFPAGEV
jgi:hypothetical protein